MRVAARRSQAGAVVDARDTSIPRRHAMTKANAEDKQVDSNEVVYGTSPRGFGIPDDYVAPKLGPLPDHINLGEHPIGIEQSYLVAAPFMMNHSEGKLQAYVSPLAGTTPSPFGDQLGIDPEQTAAAAFALDSPASTSMSWRYPPPPVRIRFNPSRAGQMQAVVTISVVGLDGSIDTKRIRVSGVGKTEPKPEPTKPDAPKIVDDVNPPDGLKAITGASQNGRPRQPVPPAATFESAVSIAQNQASILGDQEYGGAALARAELGYYKKAPAKPELFDQLIEIAFMMGVSGVAGVVAKYISKNLGTLLERPPQDTISMHPSYGPPTPGGKAPEPVMVAEPKAPLPNDMLITMTADAAKEGIKGSAKAMRNARSGSASESEQSGSQSDGRLSFNPEVDFFVRYEQSLSTRKEANGNAVGILQGLLASQDPDKARAAMETFSRGMNSAARTAAQFHANALSLQWIAATAKQSLGQDETELPDGTQVETTNLDRAREYRNEGRLNAPSVPTHGGVLDIHVDLPVGNTPVEMSGLKVRSASMTGVAQATVDRLTRISLREAGVPLRFVVHGHPALITRDEIGRVRINGYLLTKDVAAGGMKWTEAHMHRGAKFLVDQVLSKTLAAWGISGVWNEPNRIRTDDAYPKTHAYAKDHAK
jgi:hypothetical protein